MPTVSVCDVYFGAVVEVYLVFLDSTSHFVGKRSYKVGLCGHEQNYELLAAPSKHHIVGAYIIFLYLRS